MALVLVSSGLTCFINSSQGYFLHSPGILERFARTFQDYKILIRLSTLISNFLSNRLNSAKYQNIVTTQSESRSTWLLVLTCSGLGLGTIGSSEYGLSDYRALTPRSNAWTALRLAVNAPVHDPTGLGREADFLTHPEY